MPQFDFLGTWEDSWALLDSILDREGVQALPDQWYGSNIPIGFSKLNEELKAILKKKRRLYLVSKDFSLLPPFLKKQNTGEMAGKYAIVETYAGPLISLTLPACYLKNDLTNLNFGALSYPTKIFNPVTRSLQPPSRELKAAYNDIRQRSKRILVRHKIASSWIYIGRNAFNLLKAGDAEIAAPGYCNQKGVN